MGLRRNTFALKVWMVKGTRPTTRGDLGRLGDTQIVRGGVPH